jgi:hypothetical protein
MSYGPQPIISGELTSKPTTVGELTPTLVALCGCSADMASSLPRAPRRPRAARLNDEVIATLTRENAELRSKNAALNELIRVPASERPAVESVNHCLNFKSCN